MIKNLMLFVLMPAVLWAQNSDSTTASIAGYWEGAYIHEGSIQVLKMDLFEQNGEWQARFAVPDWGILGSTPRDLRYQDGRLVFAYQKKLVELSWQGADWQTIAPLVANARTQRWGKYVDLPASEAQQRISGGLALRYEQAVFSNRNRNSIKETKQPERNFIANPDFNVIEGEE